MIGLDTNVIVRYLTQDDPSQSPAATRLIDTLSAKEPGFVAMIVVVELAWVLQRAYQSPRQEIARVLESLLQTEELVIESAELIWQALRLFTASRADFADCLIERCGHAAECQHTVTFDKNAQATGMQLLKS
jgi:predicted nucleic-acid-binding protein